MNAHIITIGNELLIGDTVNTNASWMAQRLSEQFIVVDYVHTIGDDYDIITATLDFALQKADLVLMTGGLGPTNDDITKKAVADYFKAGMKIHQPTLTHIKKMFERLNITFSKSNYAQAEVPENCEVLFNESGTAPGMWFDLKGTNLVVMPGVPSEMKYFMEKKIIPRLQSKRDVKKYVVTKYLKTAGVGESTLSDIILEGVENYIKEGINLASLPDNGGVTLRISAQSETKDQTENMISDLETFLHKRAGNYIYGETRDTTLSEAVGKLLLEKNWHIAAAESCTGGLVTAALTDTPGSSAYTLGGMVTYSNAMKIAHLNVSETDLHHYGAVSKQVALQMAAGIADKTGAEIGVSATGIAGPGGGTPNKPVGTVWMGFQFPDKLFAVKALLHKNRQLNRERTVKLILEIVRRTLVGVDEMPYSLEVFPA